MFDKRNYEIDPTPPPQTVKTDASKGRAGFLCVNKLRDIILYEDPVGGRLESRETISLKVCS